VHIEIAPVQPSTSKSSAFEVARAAGVSQSAVSRAFTPGAPIAPETRQRILQAAQHLNYTPRGRARALGGERPEIAIVATDVSNPFFPTVLEAVMVRLQEENFSYRLHCVPRGTDIDSVIPDLFRRPPAGVLFSSATLSSSLAQTCRSRHVPIVLLNRFMKNFDVSMVACDNYAGGRKVADLLVRTGHERVAFIAGREEISSSGDRERGLRDGLRDAGLTLFARESGGFVYEKAFEATRRLLAAPVMPDAVFCANDIMALAAVDVISREGSRRIPEDVAVVGFDDIPMASWPAYRLTTIRQRVPIMIQEAVDLLRRLMDDPDAAGISRLVPGVLIERSTTPPTSQSAAPDEGIRDIP
jgi:DNA-binding LacI/PurR family transcriptional regulator